MSLHLLFPLGLCKNYCQDDRRTALRGSAEDAAGAFLFTPASVFQKIAANRKRVFQEDWGKD
jgi:hypothetical protein